MRKTNTLKYRNVCDIPVFTEASSSLTVIAGLVVFLFNLCLVSFIQLHVDFSQASKALKCADSSRGRPNKTV